MTRLLALLPSMVELTVVIPAAILCYLPMDRQLRVKRKQLVLWGIPALLVWAAIGGAVCGLMGWSGNVWFFPSLVGFALFFRWSVELPGWKPISVLLGVCGVYACLNGLATVADACIDPDNSPTVILTLPGAAIYVLLCWALLGVMWYPATHAIRWLLREIEMPGTWYVFWALPVFFVGLNLFLHPKDYATLYVGRMMTIYPVMVLALLGLLLFCYLMFYLMARSLGDNLRLQQENQLLQMQAAQYSALRQSIADTRQARHDLRHHFTALSALAERGAWEELRTYLTDARGTVPAAELNLCANPAVDGVAGYYAAQLRREGIPFSCRLELPEILPVAEMDACVVLSNLLENALEASRKLPPQSRFLSIWARLHGERLVLLAVKNAFGDEVAEKDGVFQSTKRAGPGVGLQSVTRIAEKNGGYCKFEAKDGIFCANVMLRGE